MKDVVCATMKGTSQESPALHFRVPADVFEGFKAEAKQREITITSLMWEKLGIGVAKDVPRPRKPVPLIREAPVSPVWERAVPEEAPTPSRTLRSCQHPPNRLVRVGRGTFCKACEEMIS